MTEVIINGQNYYQQNVLGDGRCFSASVFLGVLVNEFYKNNLNTELTPAKLKELTTKAINDIAIWMTKHIVDNVKNQETQKTCDFVKAVYSSNQIDLLHNMPQPNYVLKPDIKKYNNDDTNNEYISAMEKYEIAWKEAQHTYDNLETTIESKRKIQELNKTFEHVSSSDEVCKSIINNTQYDAYKINFIKLCDELLFTKNGAYSYAEPEGGLAQIIANSTNQNITIVDNNDNPLITFDANNNNNNNTIFVKKLNYAHYNALVPTKRATKQNTINSTKITPTLYEKFPTFTKDVIQLAIDVLGKNVDDNATNALLQEWFKYTPIATVIKHQTDRFEQLTQILNTNAKAKVIIAGKDGKHSLGIDIAKNSWEAPSYKLMEENLNMLVNNLTVAFPTRVEFGNVGWSNSSSSSFSQTDSKKNPSVNWIHVWGANYSNWNLEKDDDIRGAGQAAAMKKQVAGVFGICTMPTDDATKLIVNEESLIMHLPTPVKTNEIATTPEIFEATNSTPEPVVVPRKMFDNIVIPTNEIAEAITTKTATPISTIPMQQVATTPEILESIATATTPTPTPVATTQTNGISEIAEATISTTTTQTNNTPEIFKALAPQSPIIPVVATPEQVALVSTPVSSTTTLNKTRDNKPRPHTPFDFDAFVATIPPTLVAPSTLPAILPALANYIVNVEFCYRFLYFVRNNKNNQTDELKTIAKIIMEYYAPNDTTYFNFELKTIDLTNKKIDNIKIYTNKGEQMLEEMLKDAPRVAPQPSTTKGGRVRHCQKTIKNRKSKSKGITIRMH